MAFQLYRVDQLGTDPTGDGLVGTYPDFDAALLARDDDVVEQLADAAGGRLEVTHLIVGPGLAGPTTQHPVIAGVGQPQARLAGLDLARELAETRQWLAAIRAGRDTASTVA